MTNSFRFLRCWPAMLLFTLGLVSPACCQAQTLYDGSLGSTPQYQGWTYAAFGAASESMAGGSVLLDTTASSTTQAGWSPTAATDLNRTNGFTLLFSLQMNSEAHSSTSRSGFSLIVLSNDKNGIEINFWTNTIYALTDSPLLTHAEETAFTTTGAFVNYGLTLIGTNYLLTANGSNILSGPIRNYTAFNGFPNPYSTPNYLFFGDNTTSASASFNWANATLITAPKLQVSPTGILSWTGVSNQTYTVQSSTNLAGWTSVAAVTSHNNTFSYTNTAHNAHGFFRVLAP